MPSYETRCTSCGCETDELDQVYDQCPHCVLETEGQEIMRQDMMSRQGEQETVAAKKAVAQCLGERKAAREKRDADLVQDAIKLHDKLGDILHPLSGKSQKYHEAYRALALALLDLLDDVK